MQGRHAGTYVQDAVQQPFLLSLEALQFMVAVRNDVRSFLWTRRDTMGRTDRDKVRRGDRTATRSAPITIRAASRHRDRHTDTSETRSRTFRRSSRLTACSRRIDSAAALLARSVALALLALAAVVCSGVARELASDVVVADAVVVPGPGAEVRPDSAVSASCFDGEVTSCIRYGSFTKSTSAGPPSPRRADSVSFSAFPAAFASPCADPLRRT